MLAQAPGVMTGGVRAAVIEILIELVLAVLDDEEGARAVGDLEALPNMNREGRQ